MPLKIVNPAGAVSAAGLRNSSSRGGRRPEFYHKSKSLQAPRYDPRFRRQLEAIHSQGPVVMAYLVEELAAGADLRETVATYAALPAEFIRTYGGDRFPANLRSISGAS
jgi:hypothetical protein